MKKNKLPIKVIITDSTYKTLLNSMMSIDSFIYQKDQSKDFTYTISLTEFPLDKWEFLNNKKQILSYYSELIDRSEAKKALKKYGLL